MNIQSSGSSSSTDIRITGLSKYFGKTAALQDIDLKVAPGEFLTLLGPSGSGKSTLLMSIAGFVEPTDGNIFIGGKSVISLVPEKRNFGVVFQGYALFPHMTVKENLAYPLKVRGIPKEKINALVAETLDLVQLGHLATRYPKQLSGGQQQRVALARALVFSPEILLLDEPMGALDKKLRHDLQIELRQLHRRLGRTFVNVTHDQEEAMAMSDRIAIMNAGRIVQVGAPRELYDAPRTRFIADFLGKSNFVTGRVTEVASGEASIDTPDGPVRHCLRDNDRDVVVGNEVLLALRPEQLVIGEAPNVFQVQVQSAIFLGNYAEVTVRTKSGEHIVGQLALREAEELPVEGTEISIGWQPSATVIVKPD